MTTSVTETGSPPLRRNRKTRWLLARLVSLPHRGVGAVKVRREESCIEQRRCMAILGKLCFQCEETLRVSSQCKRHLLILVERVRYEFRQAAGMKQARSYSSGKAFPHACHNRQCHPKSVAACRVSVVGVGV